MRGLSQLKQKSRQLHETDQEIGRFAPKLGSTVSESTDCVNVSVIIIIRRF